jgi:hypothetical protein
MSAEITVERPVENRNIGVVVRCLLWRMCPIFTQKDKGCVNKGNSACKEFIRLQINEDRPYAGDLR